MGKVQIGSETKTNSSGAGQVTNYAAGKGTPGGNKGPKFPEGYAGGGMAAEEAAESPAAERAEQT